MRSAAAHEQPTPLVEEPYVQQAAAAIAAPSLSYPGRVAAPPAIPRLQAADVLALQRTAGNVAVATVLTRAPERAIHRTPTRLTAAGLNAVVNVDPALLDEGSRLLKSVAGTRPQTINDSKASSLSNCALVTMAAIEGGRTSGQFANTLRTGQGLPASDADPTKAEQSQQAWAINLEDAALMQEGRMLTPATAASSKQLAERLERFPEGAAYVIGDAQYYGMIQHLLGLAQQQSTAATQFKVFECGKPIVGQMHAQAGLVAKMQAFPSGTRFAVFLYARDPAQKVRQHWVYAENFSGQIIFRDYQRSAKPEDAYLNEFPFSPDPGEKASKSFDEGSFIAYAPSFASGPALTPPAGAAEVDPGVITGVLAGVKDKLRVLEQPLQAPGQRMPTAWQTSPQVLTQIPAPSAIQAAAVQVASQFGVAARSSYGNLTNRDVVRIISAPAHGTSAQGDAMTFSTLNQDIDVVRPGQPAAQDAMELPEASAITEEGYGQAFAEAYTISAQTGSDYIAVNVTRAQFTDLIHEAMHSFQGRALNTPLSEGLTEIFASMVAQHIQSTFADNRFEYSYNATYTAYVAAVEQLIDEIGLPVIAKVYFADPSQSDSLKPMKEAIKVRAPGSTVAAVNAVVKKLNCETKEFPGVFEQGLQELRTLATGAMALPSAQAAQARTGLYNPRKAKFANYLDAEYQRLLGGPVAQGTTPLEKGSYVTRREPIAGLEDRLKILYQHKPSTTGGQFADVMGLIGGYEKAIADDTGETVHELRMRLLPTSTITFATRYNTQPGQDVYVSGDLDELGEWDVGKAKKLDFVRDGLWEGSLSTPGTGVSVSYKYFVKQGGDVRWESPERGRHHTRLVPVGGTAARFDDNWGNFLGL